METFSVQRIYHLLKRHFFLNRKSILISVWAIYGILLMISVLNAKFNPTTYGNPAALYFTIMFIGGFIASSKVFDEMQDPVKAQSFLTLPASPLEKTMAAWLVTSPLYLLLTMLLYESLVIVGLLSSGNAFNLGLALTNANIHLKQNIGVYLVLQPMFMFAACTFKRNNFLKLLLSIFLFGFVLMIYSSLLMWIMNGASVDFSHTTKDVDISPQMINFFEGTFSHIMKVVFWWILGPYFMLVTYLKLKERQV